MFHLLPPPLSHSEARTDACDIDFGKGRDKRRQGNTVGEGKCNVSVSNLISKICSIKINGGFLWDRKGFLSTYKRAHVISSTNINSALGYKHISRKSITLPGHF